ncbi:MAG: trypsin-like peptidase domain-containing protein, partial [Synergistaceae bacterium]|nr:trypsin-like peptidase domain-containing protein [Synergistaceae bacterium]
MKDAWRHLGVSPDAGMEEIERAYAIKRRLYDPLRFAQYSQAWDEARRMSAIIEEAYHYVKEAQRQAPLPKPATREDLLVERINEGKRGSWHEEMEPSSFPVRKDRLKLISAYVLFPFIASVFMPLDVEIPWLYRFLVYNFLFNAAPSVVRFLAQRRGRSHGAEVLVWTVGSLLVPAIFIYYDTVDLTEFPSVHFYTIFSCVFFGMPAAYGILTYRADAPALPGSAAASVNSISPREEPKARAHWTAFAVGALALAVFCLAGVLFFKGRDDRARELEAANQKLSFDLDAALREVRAEAARSAVAAKPAMDAEALSARALPSIVRIETDADRMGSGFFVSNRGDILTNYHVIEGAREIRVIPHGRRAYSALVKGLDQERDMALLVLREPVETPFLKISETMPKQGEAIIALGNPRGLDSTVSNGIVSAFRLDGRLVQFAAPVSTGSSGGALIDAR